MDVAIAEEPRLLHELTGRMRFHIPSWEGCDPRPLERDLRSIAGVQRAQVNAITGNVLVLYDPSTTNSATILARARRLEPSYPPVDAAPPAQSAATQPSAFRELRGRARIAVRGLDRDPGLARIVVERLERFTTVRAKASPLTGRVLVEYDENRVQLEDLISTVLDIELPELPGEDRPSHPLDPAPLIQSAARTVGAAAGLTLLAVRRLANSTAPPVSGSAPAVVASTLGVLQGYPATRNGLRSIFGQNAADLLFQGAAIVSLALSGNPLGLALTGSESLRLLTKVVARRAAWRRYVAGLGEAPSSEPGTVVRLEAGARVPLVADVIEGTGTAIGRDGLPHGASPGEVVPAGARLFGGPFVLELRAGKAFIPEPRPAPVGQSLYSRYTEALGPVSLVYAGLTALLTRSFTRTLSALVLVNARPALIGLDAADLGAATRAIRGGVTVVGTRPDRHIRLPDLLLIDSPRVLTDGFETRSPNPVDGTFDAAELFARAASIAAAAGSPWGGAFRSSTQVKAQDGRFDGTTASADMDGQRWTLGPVGVHDKGSRLAEHHADGMQLLVLKNSSGKVFGSIVIRPRLAPGVADLVAACESYGVKIGMLGAGDAAAAEAVSRRAHVPLAHGESAVEVIRARQAQGAFVALVTDSASAASALAACDLGIGLSAGRSSHFPARADVLAPDIGAVTAMLEASARSKAVVRDAIILSFVSNALGAFLGLRSPLGLTGASQAGNLCSLLASADGWYRLRGGERAGGLAARLVDPRPERWGARSIENTLHSLRSSASGLSSDEALARRQAILPTKQPNELLRAFMDQVRSPLTIILAVGAGISLVLASPFDALLIGVTLSANMLAGVWQERRAGQAAASIERMSAGTAHVLRDGDICTVPISSIVSGDVLVLAAGDRVAADARLLEAQNLEVDEALLTGESLPVAKDPNAPTDGGRIVLDGTDVTVGTGRAVAFAVGGSTRMGATASALSIDDYGQSPLGVRLSRMLQQVLPITVIGGAIVVASGILRRRPLLPQLAIGASVAIAAVPEGLPILAGVGQAAVASRLASRKALVKRVNAVEALGRVDVACTDKTGTLTEGRLRLTTVATMGDEEWSDGKQAAPLEGELRRVLKTAALASPSPDASDARAHPTDVAIVQRAFLANLGDEIRVDRVSEAPFDPVRSLHASATAQQLSVKGAAEAVLPRCVAVRRGGLTHDLDQAGRDMILHNANELASRGLRVLMVAEGSRDEPTGDPQGLIALGFVGISDPLRADVHAAVRRCQAAGIKVIMLTGDHPATAQTIAREAGLLLEHDGVINGAELSDLHNGELDRRLKDVSVIARVTPIDKLRIVESLQRQGHVVAMTGDGVNDAPALRLADVGVAMGRGGTEVARQAADVVLADDDFATLVDALVEGRSFWHNIRRALGLLLGGNLGELGLVVGASAVGLASPLVTRQILAVNLITDALPALAVALQQPPHRNLAALAREGAASLDEPLRNDVIRRGIITAAPAFVSYVVALRASGLMEARTVAFASIVATQLTQTLQAGRSDGGLSRPVVAAVAGSAGLLGVSFVVPALRQLLQLAVPGPLGWTLIGASIVFGQFAGSVTNSAGTSVKPALHIVPRLPMGVRPVTA